MGIKVLYIDEKDRALRLLKDGLTSNEIALRLVKSRDYSLWSVMKMEIEEILTEQRNIKKEAILSRNIWDVLEGY